MWSWGETLAAFLEAVEDSNPSRVVFDSTAELRLLAGDALRYRRQMLGLRQFFSDRGCTVLMLGGHDRPRRRAQRPLGRAFGVGAVRPPSTATCAAACGWSSCGAGAFRGGHHNFAIRTGGLEVYPRLVTSGGGEYGERDTVTSGVAELDALLGGGLEEGTACLMVGPTGTGKSSVTTLYVHAAAGAGGGGGGVPFRRAPRDLLSAQRGGWAWTCGPLEEAGVLSVVGVDTGELVAGASSRSGSARPWRAGPGWWVIDSLTGLLPRDAAGGPARHPDARAADLFEAVAACSRCWWWASTASWAPTSWRPVGHVLHGGHRPPAAPLRGRGRAAQGHFGPLKSATVSTRPAIRELRLRPGGIEVGEPVRAFSGVLAGSPTYEGDRRALLEEAGSES